MVLFQTRKLIYFFGFSEQKYLKVVGRMKEENSDKTSKMRSLGEKVRSLTKRVQQLETYENQV